MVSGTGKRNVFPAFYVLGALQNGSQLKTYSYPFIIIKFYKSNTKLISILNVCPPHKSIFPEALTKINKGKCLKLSEKLYCYNYNK